MTPGLRVGLVAILLSTLLAVMPEPVAERAWAQDASSTAAPSTAMVPNWAPARPDSVASGTSSILTARVGDHGNRTRFVLEMSEAAEYRIFSLENPDRMVIDFEASDWQAGPPREPGIGLVAGHRHGRRDGGAVRVVLDLTGPAEILDSFYLPAVGTLPYRFVLDLAPDGSGQPATPSPAPVEPSYVAAAATSVAPIPPPIPSRRVGRRIVAIDAGHGGIDPGAIGITGLREKDVTLDVAKRLRTILEATGRYEVVLTREYDVFLRLRHRVEIAREAGAELLISLHADSISDSRFRGASVYTLSDVASDREAEQLAARENRADALAGVALEPVDDVTATILIDLAQRHTQNESSSMARSLVTYLSEATRMIGTEPHREAGFAVLKAPDVPSVLVELGYLSNRSDEQELRSPQHRRDLAQAIAGAVDRHFGWRGASSD